MSRSALRRCVEGDVGPRIAAALGPRASLALRLSSRWWRGYVRSFKFQSIRALRSAIRAEECDLYDSALSNAHACGHLFAAGDWAAHDDAVVYSGPQWSGNAGSYYNPLIVALPGAANWRAGRSFAVTMQCRQASSPCAYRAAPPGTAYTRPLTLAALGTGGYVALSQRTRAELLASARSALRPGVVRARDLDIQLYQSKGGQFCVTCATPGTIPREPQDVTTAASGERCGTYVGRDRTTYVLPLVWAHTQGVDNLTYFDAFRVAF